MSYPDSVLIEIPTVIAEELLTKAGDMDASSGLLAWLGFLRGDIVNAKAQHSFFEDGLGS